MPPTPMSLPASMIWMPCTMLKMPKMASVPHQPRILMSPARYFTAISMLSCTPASAMAHPPR
jgi:hypothetical protein